MTARKYRHAMTAAPWNEHLALLAAFFYGDGRITVERDPVHIEGTPDFEGIVRVDEPDLALALECVLRTIVDFGTARLRLKVTGIDAETCLKIARRKRIGKKFTRPAALGKALELNPAFDRIRARQRNGRTVRYCIFRPVVLQWDTGNPRSPWGVLTGTYESAAPCVFADEPGALYCTRPPGPGA